MSANPIRFLEVVLATALLVVAVAARAGAACPGDCNGDGRVAVDELVRGVAIALGAAPLASCIAIDRNRDGTVMIDELVGAVRAALDGCARHRTAFVVVSDFETGGFATVALDEPRTVVPVDEDRLLHSDAVARVAGGRVYVLNRLFADTVQVLDPAGGFTTELLCSTGRQSNPHDIVVRDATRAYVSRFGEKELLVINPSARRDCSDFAISTIDLSAYADADGIPEMDQMALVGDRLYVALQRLDRRNLLLPAQPGMIAVIDTRNDRVVDTIELSGENPFAATKGLTVYGGKLLVSLTGRLREHDGGIERIDIASHRGEGFVVSEADLGGDIIDFVFASDERAFAVVNHHDFSTSLLAFNPSRGAIESTLIARANYVADIELNDRGELYVADRTFRRPGLRVFRAADGTELTERPIDLGLPPFEILFLR